MKLIKIFSAILLSIAGSISVAQTQTSNNLITNPNFNTTSGWSVTGMAGGQQYHPAQPPNGTGYSFSYMQGTIAQTYAINQALSGVGIQVQGFDYGFQYQIYCANGFGGNCQNPSGPHDTLSYTATITNSAGQNIYTNSQNLSGGYMASPVGINVQQRFPSAYSLANLGNFSISFTGMDGGYWGGNYGPTISNVYSRAVYTVDPCVGNPRYSPSCAGYNDANMWSTGDLTSIYGTSFAINQALGFGNTGVRVHSATWGYDYSIGGQWCSGFSLLGICFQWSDSYVGGAVAITDINTNVIASDSNHTSGQNITGSFRREILLGSTSPDISTLGGAAVSTYSGGVAAVTPYLEFNFTPDICSSNPLASAQCPGYAAAYFTQQCTANPLYDQSCPGYAQAYFTQQCNANQLYNPSCPGYAAAYLTYQCNISQLYSPSCPGYQQAYLDQQCSANPLYSSSCANYQTATAQCSADPLSAAYCPGYQSALTACTNNGLAYTYCPTYQTELNYCSTDPLFNNLCPTYQTAVTQCSANALSAAYCPNYQTTLNACSANPLSNNLCSGYTAASNACSANQLTYTYCPSYTTALAACSTNPQGNTMCPGYSSTASSGGGSGGGASTVSSTTEPSVKVASDGKVSTEVALVADSNVDSVIKEKATSTAPSPTATVNLAPQPDAQSPAAPMAVAQENKKEEKKEETKTADSSSGKEDKKEDKKEETKTADSSSSSTTTASTSSEQKKDQPKTTRQEIQERRVAAARAKAIEDGKQMASKMGEAASLEAQVAVQNVVIAAMGFTPGFDNYSKAFLFDVPGYRPFEIYKGQRNVDNPAGRRFLTGADARHQEMVDQQYNRER